MTDSRRNFFAKFFGGAAALAVGGTPLLAEANLRAAASRSPDPVPDEAEKLLEASSLAYEPEPAQEPNLRIVTDLTPGATRFMTGENELLFVQELMVEFHPASVPLVGLSLFSFDTEPILKPGVRAIYPKLKQQATTFFPRLTDQDDKPIGLNVYEMRRDITMGCTELFAFGRAPIEITKPFRFDFRQCSHCGTFEQMPLVDEAHKQWKMAQADCIRCGRDGGEWRDFSEPWQLRTLYMTPGSSHATFRLEYKPEELQHCPTPCRLPVRDRLQWLIKDCDGQLPVAEIFPVPTAFNILAKRAMLALNPMFALNPPLR